MTEFDQLPVALWSNSMSARVALGVTALDELGRCPRLPGSGIRQCVRIRRPDGARLAAIDRFLTDGEVRRPPEAWTSAAVVSPDQATIPSALKPLTAFRWFIEYRGRYGSGWTNRVVFTVPVDAPDFDRSPAPPACASRPCSPCHPTTRCPARSVT